MSTKNTIVQPTLQLILAFVVAVLSLSLLILGFNYKIPTVYAATYVVNTLDDFNDGTCDIAHCSLREAIESANNSPGPDTIVFNVDGVFMLNSNTLFINDDVNILGNGQGNTIIDGANLNESIFTNYAQAYLVDLSLQGADHHNDGGAIYNEGSLMLQTVSISNNRIRGTSRRGGGIYNSFGIITITNSILAYNAGDTSNTQGGGIYNNYGQINIFSSTVVSNYVRGEGSGIYNNGGTIDIQDYTLIEGNGGYDTDHGGGIYNTNDGSITIENSTIVGNMVDNIGTDGGGIYNNSGSILLLNSIINNNSASNSDGNGGGIYNGLLGTLSIQNSTIANNIANSSGSGIYNDGGNITIQNNTIIESNGGGNAGDGGGIFNTNNGTIAIGNSAIVNNIIDNSNTHGGGIYNNNSSITIINSTINNNSADGNDGRGGGIYNIQGNITMLGGTLISNTTTNNGMYDLYEQGGGIYNTGFLHLEDVLIESNLAGDDGGAIYNDNGGEITLINNNIVNNSAADNGGAIYQGTGYTSIYNTNMFFNQADNQGGAIYNKNTLIISNTTIHSNTSYFDGGGIYQEGGYMNLGNVTISSNYSDWYGGGIYSKGSNNYFNNVTIFNNFSYNHGGGIYLQDILDMENTILAGNLSFNGNNNDCGSSGNLNSFGYNLIGDTINSSCDFFLDPTDITNIPPNLYPLADNGGPTSTHAPYPGSPIINNGSPFNCLPTDQRGVSRPQGTACDIGAYELTIPDLQFSKHAHPITAPAASIITFTLMVTNASYDTTASDLIISDPLHPDLLFIDNSLTMMPFIPGTVLANTAADLPTLVSNLTLSPLQSVMFTFQAMINPAAPDFIPITNTATISYYGTSLISASTSILVLNPYLELNKTVNELNPPIGSPLTYTITITNYGLGTALNTTVLDLLPPGLQFVGPISLNPPHPEATVATSAADLPTLVYSLTLNPYSMVDITLPVIVSSTAPFSTPLINTAAVYNNIAWAEDSITITTFIPPLSTHKTVNHPTPAVGELITYSIAITNPTLITLNNISVTDLLPSGLNLAGPVRVTPPGLPINSIPPLLTDSLSIDPLSTVIFDIPVQVDFQLYNNNILTNTALIFNPIDQTTFINQVPITIYNPTISLSKSVNNPTPSSNGDFITYTLVISNNGPGDLLNAVISDSLATGLTLAGPITLNPPTAGVVGNNPPILATDLSILAAQAVTLTVPVVLDSGLTPNTPIINQATISVANTSLAADYAIITPTLPVFAITKQVNPTSLNTDGGLVTYTIVVNNYSNTPLNNGLIEDILDPNLSLAAPISLNPSNAGIIGSPPQIVSALNIAAQQQVTVTMPVSVAAGLSPGTLINNQATVTFGSDSNSDQATVTITPSNVDLTITKNVNQTTPAIGEIITYSIILTNNGETDINALTISDTLAAGLKFIGPIHINPPNTILSGASLPLITTNLTVPAQSSIVLSFPVQVMQNPTQSATILNTIQVSGPNLATPLSANVAITVNNPNLTLSKSASDHYPIINGQLISYTIIATNSGPGAITTATLSDTLPAGLTLGGAITLSPATAGVVGTPPTLISQLSMAAGESIIVTVPVIVDSPIKGDIPLLNQAVLEVADLKVTATTTITPVLPPLDISKRVNQRLVPHTGATLTYTIIISNNQDITLNNLTVADPLNTALTLAGTINLNPPTAGTIGTPPNLVISLTIGANQQVTVTVPVNVEQNLEPGTLINNQVTVSNNQHNVSDEETIIILQATADLTITKQVNTPNPAVGEIITYTIIVTNNGLSNSNTGTIIDSLPPELAFIGPVTLYPADNGNPGTPPTLGTNIVLKARDKFTAGNSLILKFPVKVLTGPSEGNEIINTAFASFGITPLPVDSVAITVLNPNISLQKQVNNTTPTIGELITYTLIAHNSGPGHIANATLTDPLPPDLMFVGPINITPPQAGLIGTPPTVAHTLYLGTGESITVTIPVIVSQTATINQNIKNTALFSSGNFSTTAYTNITIISGSVGSGFKVYLPIVLK